MNKQLEDKTAIIVHTSEPRSGYLQELEYRIAKDTGKRVVILSDRFTDRVVVSPDGESVFLFAKISVRPDELLKLERDYSEKLQKNVVIIDSQVYKNIHFI